MSAQDLARLQARAYRDMSSWAVRDLADLLAQPSTLLVAEPQAFCLGRVIVDEAEILALATDPDHQRQGKASRLLRAFSESARDRGAETLFIEVAATNGAALDFYHNHCFARTGLRKGYYRQPDGSRVDALLMSRALTRGQAPDP